MFTFKSVRSIVVFSHNKYIDIELPNLICTEFVFTLLALHYPPNFSHTYTNARAPVPSLFPFSRFCNPAKPQSARFTFYRCSSAFVHHTYACTRAFYSYARLVAFTQSNDSLIQQLSRVPSVVFSITTTARNRSSCSARHTTVARRDKTCR